MGELCMSELCGVYFVRNLFEGQSKTKAQINQGIVATNFSHLNGYFLEVNLK